MNQRMMIRQNILVLGFNPEEQNRLVELLSSSESDCPFCVWIEPGTENPDLVLERFRPGMTPFSRMHQVPVLGLVWREDANKIQHDFVYQDVLLWETLSADWLAVSVRRVIERFLRESERRDIRKMRPHVPKCLFRTSVRNTVTQIQRKTTEIGRRWSQICPNGLGSSFTLRSDQ